ncbi:hypothetical protein LRS10_13140 [Phenylobacterium sp. J426]|uniref:hypothetical protein n=1 Tax=Phenylobacterium sp. J426 TaxID=2898439 RepID=UPI002150CFBF|nr:hypothetical protein [Phenylobacterium sp. J426]MCR5875042.1 hypothetical protein [Phenylobacterium sp. J426]
MPTASSRGSATRLVAVTSSSPTVTGGPGAGRAASPWRAGVISSAPGAIIRQLQGAPASSRDRASSTVMAPARRTRETPGQAAAPISVTFACCAKSSSASG